MSITVTCSSSTTEEAAARQPIAVFVHEDAAALPSWAKNLPADLRSALASAQASDAFGGKAGQTKIVHAADNTCAILVGLGKKRRLDTEAIRRAYGNLIRAARAERIKSLSAPLLRTNDLAASAEAATVGANLANYLFKEYRSDTSKLTPQIESLDFIGLKAPERRKADRGIASGTIMASATCRVRDLVNTPANDLTPKAYAQRAGQWCKAAGVKLQVMTLPEIKKTGMGAVMAVGGGSNNEPRFLTATYNGRKGQVKTVDVALVGKGVTFDSGGISLKPPTDMWEMRGDMMGSAVVLATICAAADLKLPVNIITLTPLVENMPSGNAYRPGDIVRTLSGQTVEIMSTDAEGRMILADALYYAQRYEPKVIIDVATLTGAVAVALGDVCCGFFTDSDKHARAIKRASAATGERAWRLPLFEEYDETFKSDVADMKNGGIRWGGGCIAARILKRFVGDYPWVHIDIAGVDLDKRGHDYCPKGPTGFGPRLLLEMLRS